MNSNAVHNILNIGIAVLGAATGALIATGCVDTGAGLDCSQSWISPVYTSVAVTVLGVAKSLINVARDGIGNLFKPQPPVGS